MLSVFSALVLALLPSPPLSQNPGWGQASMLLPLVREQRGFCIFMKATVSQEKEGKALMNSFYSKKLSTNLSTLTRVCYIFPNWVFISIIFLFQALYYVLSLYEELKVGVLHDCWFNWNQLIPNSSLFFSYPLWALGCQLSAILASRYSDNQAWTFQRHDYFFFSLRELSLTYNPV